MFITPLISDPEYIFYPQNSHPQVLPHVLRREVRSDSASFSVPLHLHSKMFRHRVGQQDLFRNFRIFPGDQVHILMSVKESLTPSRRTVSPANSLLCGIPSVQSLARSAHSTSGYSSTFSYTSTPPMIAAPLHPVPDHLFFFDRCQNSSDPHPAQNGDQDRCQRDRYSLLLSSR